MIKKGEPEKVGGNFRPHWKSETCKDGGKGRLIGWIESKTGAGYNESFGQAYVGTLSQI